MTRINFKVGEQRKFLQQILEKTNCPSLRTFTQFGLDIPYSTLKNYFSEQRKIPESLFNQLCELAKINPKKISTERLNENWGQIKGGKISKKDGPTRN